MKDAASRATILTSERAAAVRSLIAVRWVGILFALYQISTFSDGYPSGFRTIGIVGSLAYAAFNTLLWIASRRDLRERGVTWLALGTLALDFIAMAGFVSLFTFDENNPVWALLYILPLEGALLFQRRGALGMMALAGIFYTAHEFAEEQIYGVPFVLDGVTFRIGVGFVIAWVAGVMHSNLMTERERSFKGEKRLEALQRNSQDVTSVIDATGTLIYTSPAAADVTGYTPDELVSRTGFDFVHEDDIPLATRFLERVVSGPGARAEETFRIYHKDGSIRWVRMRGTNALDDPAIEGIVTNLQDVTEVEKSAHELKRVNQRFATLLANLPGMAYRCHNDQDWTLEFVSEGALQLTGYTAAELVEKQGFKELIHPEDSERVWTEVQASLDVGDPFEIEYRIITRDGAEKWVWEQGRAITYDGEGFLEGLLIDVTERKKLEMELNQAQKMEAVGRLAGGIAHDFNNLMAVVTNYADFIAGDLPEKSQMRDDVEEIHRAGQRGADLVRQLLTFSRKAQIAPEPLMVDDVVANVMNLLRRSVGEDITIKTSLAADRCVLIDRGQLEQVLMNLVVNARDAMPNGGLLTITTRMVSERRRADAAESEWVGVSVTDDGEGIPPETMGHIFEPFFTTKETGKGTGLGLATVYGIVQKAGGWIDVSSEPGAGATFDIYLPVTDIAPTADDLPATVAAPSSGKKSILLIEDEEPVKAVIQRILTQAGHEVVSASRPAEALEVYESGKFDLVITDVVMPGMSGRMLAEELQRQGSTAPVIFMSGYNEEIVADRGLEGHVLLQKPFTAEVLLRAVNDRLAAE